MGKKTTLKIDYTEDLDFVLTGISCGLKDYKLCFDINKALELRLERADDLTVLLQRPGASTVHTCYKGKGEDNERYYLIANKDKNGTGYLIPEYRNLNYFFLIAGESGLERKNTIADAIRNIQIVEGAYDIAPSGLKTPEIFLGLLDD